MNFYLGSLEDLGLVFDTVRCGFIEGERAFPGSGIYQQTHIQIAVRNCACIVGTFRPTVQAWMTEPREALELAHEVAYGP